MLDLARLKRLLGGTERAALRLRLRRRFERDRHEGTFTLASLTPVERETLEALLGRRTRLAGSMRLSLAELDAALANCGAASDTRTALEALDGVMLDPVALAKQRRAWDAALAGASLAVQPLLANSRGRRLIRRLARGDAGAATVLLDGAEQVLARLPAPGLQRSRLAADALGDAHALDAGRPVAKLVLAILRADDNEKAREAWARSGVLVNELAKPVLVLNVPAPDRDASPFAAGLGEPAHLNLRWLMRRQRAWPVQGLVVFVCENPSLVAAAADALGATCPPLVCTDGMPAAAQQALLQQLIRSGAQLRYHGDFDWPGIHIGNVLVTRFGVAPWRFGSSDYTANSGKLLAGEVVAAVWDPELAGRMAAMGFTQEEERVQDLLLADLEAHAAKL